MDRLIPVIAGGVLASLSCALYVVVRYRQVKSAGLVTVMRAEKDLLHDINQIGADELGETIYGCALICSLMEVPMLFLEGWPLFLARNPETRERLALCRFDFQPWAMKSEIYPWASVDERLLDERLHEFRERIHELDERVMATKARRSMWRGLLKLRFGHRRIGEGKQSRSAKTSINDTVEP